MRVNFLDAVRFLLTAISTTPALLINAFSAQAAYAQTLGWYNSDLASKEIYKTKNTIASNME